MIPVLLPSLLAKFGVLDEARQSEIAKAVNAACQAMQLTTRNRLACFVGQCAVESGRFTRFVENLNYKTPARARLMFPSAFPTEAAAKPYMNRPEALANFVYATRNGNRGLASGDGWNYRGRAPIQITGLDNYIVAHVDTGIDCVNNPDLLELLPEGFLASANYFKNNCLEAADRLDIDTVTRRVNGKAMAEAALRRQYTQQLLSNLPT